MRDKAREARDFRRRQNAHYLSPLTLGDTDMVTDANCRAQVSSLAQRPRSYIVTTPWGTPAEQEKLVARSLRLRPQESKTPDLLRNSRQAFDRKESRQNLDQRGSLLDPYLKQP